MSKSYSLSEMQRRFRLTFAEAQRRHSILEQLWKAETQLDAARATVGLFRKEIDELAALHEACQEGHRIAQEQLAMYSNIDPDEVKRLRKALSLCHLAIDDLLNDTFLSLEPEDVAAMQKVADRAQIALEGNDE